MCLLCISVVCGVAVAADAPWPSKPIKFVVPYAAGGASDITARLLAQSLSSALGQPVVVDNRAGASGNIGTDVVAKSPADGYTILLAYTGPMAINPHLYKSLPFDPARDFAPVGQVAEAPLILMVNAGIPARSVPELIAQVKAEPGKFFCGSSGPGGADHLACELFKVRTGTQVGTVNYKGGLPALMDLVAGRTQMQFATTSSVMSHIRSGALRPLAFISSKRFDLLPDVPTASEAGLPAFDVNNWYGVSVPAGTPPAVIKRLSVELGTALQQPALRTRLQELGLVPAWTSTEDFAAYVKAELVRWGPIVRAAGVTVE